MSDINIAAKNNIVWYIWSNVQITKYDSTEAVNPLLVSTE